MKVLVTGANGYLGQGVVRQLLDDGNTVIAASRHMNNVDERAIRLPGDIFEEMFPFERYSQPDVLLHMAWRNGFVHNDESHLQDLPRHYEFIKRMIRGGVKQVAVLGSMHEIGFYEGCIKPKTPANPQSLYGVSKNALRQAVQLLAQKNDVVFQWLRGYYIVGNTKFGCSIFSKITQAEMEGKLEFPFTSGQNQWDFLDYDDFCKQTCAAVGQVEYDGIIDICSGRPMKLADRVESFIQKNNYNIKLAYGKFPDRPYDSKAVWGDDKKIQMIMYGMQGTEVDK